MGKIKAGTIITTGVIGGVIGVSIVAVGKAIGNKTVGQIGDGVADSALMTGEIIGDVFEGVADTSLGIAKKNSRKKEQGVDQLKTAGISAINNIKHNIVTVGGATKDVAVNVAHKDKEGAKKAGRKLLKIVSVGLITVGAIKVNTEDEVDIEECEEQKKDKEKM